MLPLRSKKNVKQYYVYWGHTGDAPPPPNLEYHRGLLMEMHQFGGMPPGNGKQILHDWNESPDPIGKAIVERPFIGNNVLGDYQRTISKFTGHLFAPIDGNYDFAMAADDRGLLMIDNQEICFAQFAPSDTRFHGSINLKRGDHNFLIYHVDVGGTWILSVGWKRPDTQKIEILTRDAFGYAFPGDAGPMEERGKSMVADFVPSSQGEIYYADHYSQHLRFVAVAAKVDRATYQWDFGDGQSTTGQQVDHVYLVDGVFPLKLTVKIGGNSDSRTSKIVVSRDFADLIRPHVDDINSAARIVAGYKLASLDGAELNWAVNLQLEVKDKDAMLAAATALAGKPKVADVERAYAALCHVADEARSKPGPTVIAQLWAAVPATSNLQPRAVRQQARALLWGLGDPASAVKALRSVGDTSADTQAMLGVALVLSGSADDGSKMLRDTRGTGDADKHAALAGAMARTIEYDLDQKDADTGDEQWDHWQAMYPGDFLEGYSLLLKTRLVELRGEPVVAARLAEQFAVAMPGSSYAPQLLDRASKLLAKSDPDHAKQLHDLLKKRYPEDPLSQ